MSPMKIRIKSDTHSVVENLHKTLCKSKVKYSRIILRGMIYDVYCNDYCDADNIFSDTCIASLENFSFFPIMPPELKSKRCVIIKRLDSFIFDHTEDQILEELNSKNNALEAVSLMKFPNSRTIKVNYKNQKMVDNCMEKGVKLFFYHVSPSDIKKDNFIKILTCFKCYKIDDHLKHNCPNEDSFRVCSECSSSDHTYTNCTSVTKKCINCEGAHSTLAYRCPMRKKFLVDYAKNQNGHNQQPSYNSVVRNTPNNTKDTVLAQMCIMTAALKENENPGSYETVLNTLLRVNNLPQFNMGGISPPKVNLHAPLTSEPTISPPSISVPSSSRQSTAYERNVQHHSIKLWKRNDVTANITSKNVKLLVENGKVLLECDSANETTCLEQLLKTANKEFPKAIPISIEEFITKLCHSKRNSPNNLSAARR